MTYQEVGSAAEQRAGVGASPGVPGGSGCGSLPGPVSVEEKPAPPLRQADGQLGAKLGEAVSWGGQMGRRTVLIFSMKFT